MLDQLRAMGVFACVVEKSSFSGAARELGITTSAVSQQIRSLENEMEVILLHRSTRKLSLTEAGQAFFHSCREMLAAAERGKVRINELRDELVGDLRIATTPEIGAMHLVPALSHWISAHRGLSVHFEAENKYIDLIEGRIDIAVRMSSKIEDSNLTAVPLARVEQILVASPSYLNQSAPISRPEDLKNHDLIPINVMNNYQQFSFQHGVTSEVVDLEMRSRLYSNNVLVAKSLCQHGHGLARILYLDVQKDLINGSLVEVLPEWKLPAFTLYAIISRREQQPMKIHRCLDALKQYFSQLPGGRVYQEAS
ncbi:LysR family transcriptional regulator [Acinetobacter radioresistens]|jgi:DNA-binding transcriptional LysR family regulator|uniref:LysR family transcriptional regulator n=2 Tax=Acinetobacter radioresistens TaxID=40216 RepID=A0A3A4D791_ACIRA|nr:MULTISPECIES: LysR family transcriptional regulator [Acinetobacter]AWV85853.1 LysR family transcriptional regulator [Acinetobacter radioresistens]EET81594.1 LysR substrate binding domain protein [Acinetobacter radioresistens SK82]EXE60892.1 bacterial regulatory helix-turn-helix, lysR family protein [Acinetobacter sp. 1239920]EXF56370.1 bacterial regulatory helix-turn-helix, lysR family protein [Acinetobacter sp. 1294596]MCK4086846.1 LysR family transcriptional regulator [Acinetobacter radio